MKFSCSRSALAEVLALLNEVVPARSAKPVLQNIRIVGNDDGSITLSATDLEIGLRYKMDVNDLQDPCEILLPGSKLSGLIRDDWANMVNVTVEDDKAEISTENGTFHLVGNASEEFPIIKDLPENDIVEVGGADLVDAIRKTTFAAAKGDTRYALNGTFIHMEDKDLELVASDTHRLSLVKKKSRTSAKKAEAIVITKGMLTLGKLASGEETVKLHLTTHELIAETSRATLVARLVDGQFPRYRDVIPRDLEIKVTVDRELFQRTLRLGGQVSNEETHSISVSAKGNNLLVSVTGNESGDGRIEMPAEISGGEVTAGFNYVYLMDVLKVIDEDTVTIQFRDSENPARIDSGDMIHIIMPIKPRG